jgi:small-conductance mechanosensitive channel
VGARQYTGRIVTVTNDRIFDDPVYNYTREFPYLWEEMRIPVRYGDDWDAAERIVLEAGRRHTVKLAEIGADALAELTRRYVVTESELEPRVFWRITDNWLELTLRFVCRDHGIRELKDAISRDILARFRAAGLQIASATQEITVFRGPPETEDSGAAA